MTMYVNDNGLVDETPCSECGWPLYCCLCSSEQEKEIKMAKVKCLECGKILESKFRHDFQSCGCPQGTFVDGGQDYTRIGGADLKKIEVIED